MGAGEPPTKVGRLREDILFESKEYPLALPKKDSGRDFEFPSQTLLETTKGRAAALPLETSPKGTGELKRTGAGASLRAYGGRWDEGQRPGAGCLRSFGAPCLAGGEGDDGSVDLEPALLGYSDDRAGQGSLVQRELSPSGD